MVDLVIYDTRYSTREAPLRDDIIAARGHANLRGGTYYTDGAPQCDKSLRYGSLTNRQQHVEG